MIVEPTKPMKYKILPFIMFLSFSTSIWANKLFIPMDESQKNHLKSYGLAFWLLKSNGQELDWLLNYRGGSFMVDWSQKYINECIIRGISYESISDAQAAAILTEIAQPDANMDAVKLNKAPKVAVYSPKAKQPWDDAVTLVMTYAEIPYEVVFDEEVMDGKLLQYDWLHLHHEDFTGQYGKFIQYRGQAWYQEQKKDAEEIANKYGFTSVPELKESVVKKIRDYVAGGGYMFAMCNATDTFDIVLAAGGNDLVESVYDGDAADPNINQKLDYSKTFAFKDFSLYTEPQILEFSTIDTYPNFENSRPVGENNDFFTLFQFSAKWDPVPSMLTQNHAELIHGFMGQTTSFKKALIKPEVVVLGEFRQLNEARYIHSTFGKGFWTFYGGHDPEDYQHTVGEEPTDLALHPNSSGYRLILNNVLFPAAKKKKLKT